MAFDGETSAGVDGRSRGDSRRGRRRRGGSVEARRRLDVLAAQSSGVESRDFVHALVLGEARARHRLHERARERTAERRRHALLVLQGFRERPIDGFALSARFLLSSLFFSQSRATRRRHVRVRRRGARARFRARRVRLDDAQRRARDGSRLAVRRLGGRPRASALGALPERPVLHRLDVAVSEDESPRAQLFQRIAVLKVVPEREHERASLVVPVPRPKPVLVSHRESALRRAVERDHRERRGRFLRRHPSKRVSNRLHARRAALRARARLRQRRPDGARVRPARRDDPVPDRRASHDASRVARVHFHLRPRRRSGAHRRAVRDAVRDRHRGR